MFTLSFPFYIPTVVQVCHLELVYIQYFILPFHNSKFAICFLEKKSQTQRYTSHLIDMSVTPHPSNHTAASLFLAAGCEPSKRSRALFPCFVARADRQTRT